MTWERPQIGGNMPSSRAYHSTITLGSKMIVFGGMDGLRCFNETFVFDTSSLKWSQCNFYGRAPPPRHKHTASNFGSQMWYFIYPFLFLNDCDRIFGGMEAPPNAFNDFFMLNITSKELFEIKTETTSSSSTLTNSSNNPALTTNHILPINSIFSQATNNPNIPKPQLSLLPTSMNIEKTTVPVEQYNALREELEKSNAKIEILTGKNWDRCSFYELEELEKLYLEGLQRVSLAKVRI